MRASHPARVAAAAGIVAVSLAGAGVAHAVQPTNVWVENGVLRVQAPTGQNNTITLIGTPGSVITVQSPSGLAGAAQCQPVAADRVVCASGFTSFQVESNDGNDTVRNETSLPGKVFAGAGNDNVTDGPGNQTIDLGAGNDIAFVGLGRDIVIGGAGIDGANYATRTVPVTVNLDASANDGQPGEGDTIRTDVENVTGGSAADKLIGSAVANVLLGREGNDTLTGNAGSDTANGGSGSDTCQAEIRISCP